MHGMQHIDAMRDRRISIAVIYTRLGYVVMESGLLLPIVEFLERDKRTSCEREDASFFTFGHPEVGYATTKMPEPNAQDEWNH